MYNNGSENYDAMGLGEQTQLNIKEKLKIVIKSFLSLHFIKLLVSSFTYYLFEHIYWKFDIITKRVYRIYSTTSIRNAKNMSLGFDTQITTNCIVWAGKISKMFIGGVAEKKITQRN